MSLREFCEITVATAKNQSLQDKPLSEIPPKQHNSVIGLTKLLFSSGSVENAMKIVKLSFSDYTRKALFQMVNTQSIETRKLVILLIQGVKI